MSKIEERSIKSVIDAILAADDKNSDELFEKLRLQPAVASATNYLQNGQVEEFDLLFSGEIKEVIEAVVASVTKKSGAVFLALQYEFVYAHFSKLIEKEEGVPCSDDKVGTIIRALFHHLKNGDAIAFNYEQQYTFHLPKKIFKTQAEIVGFFEGLHRLYYGDPERYLKEMSKMRRVLKGDEYVAG